MKLHMVLLCLFVIYESNTNNTFYCVAPCSSRCFTTKKINRRQVLHIKEDGMNIKTEKPP